MNIMPPKTYAAVIPAMSCFNAPNACVSKDSPNEGAKLGDFVISMSFKSETMTSNEEALLVKFEPREADAVLTLARKVPFVTDCVNEFFSVLNAMVALDDPVMSIS